MLVVLNACESERGCMDVVDFEDNSVLVAFWFGVPWTGEIVRTSDNLR